jgi:hypothetical protein
MPQWPHLRTVLRITKSHPIKPATKNMTTKKAALSTEIAVSTLFEAAIFGS